MERIQEERVVYIHRYYIEKVVTQMHGRGWKAVSCQIVDVKVNLYVLKFMRDFNN
jgi:hypothetical protein